MSNSRHLPTRSTKNKFVDKEVQQAITKANERQRMRLESFTRKSRLLTSGAKVMVRVIGLHKEIKFEWPYIVKECVTPWKYHLQHVVTKKEKTRNYNQLKILKEATRWNDWLIKMFLLFERGECNGISICICLCFISPMYICLCCWYLCWSSKRGSNFECVVWVSCIASL